MTEPGGHPSCTSTGRLVRAASARLPTRFGDFRVHAYEGSGSTHHAAVVMGEPSAVGTVTVRVHSSCRTGDIFASLRCDCGPQLHASLRRIAEEGVGVVVYLDQEGRGIGLPDKIRAYALQDGGLDTVDANRALGHPADLRDYTPASQILSDLDIHRVRLLTNNPRKVDALDVAGLVVERVPLVVEPNPHNVDYLRAKARRLGHEMDPLDP